MSYQHNFSALPSWSHS